MINNFSLYLALRYLRPKRTFVSVITVISVLGVTFGVAALLVVISVMRGFHSQIHELAASFETHIETFDRFGSSMMPSKERPKDVQEKSWRDVLKAIEATPGVTSATPMVGGLMLIEGPENDMVPTAMWGVRQDDSNKLAQKHKDFLIAGSMDLQADDQGDKVIIDRQLARRWGAQVGDVVSVYAPSNLRDVAKLAHEMDEQSEEEKKDSRKKLKELVAEVKMRVGGIVSWPQLQDSDKMPVCVVALHVAQELRNLDDGISSIGIEVAEPYKAGEIKDALVKSALPDTWESYTWIEKHKQLFDTVQNELEMMYFVLFIIVVVAAFCVMNTMITVTVQKRREIGIISALGSRVGQIMWVFLTQGMIVGVFGALSGLGLGLLITWLRNDIRWAIAKLTGREIFSEAIYGLAKIPAKVVMADVNTICIGAFVLCTLASLVPAWLAARTEPAVALRD